VDPSEQNRRAWDEIHRRRAEVMRGELGLPAPIRERLQNLAGVRVLHLQCGTGEATAELVALGGLVTGVDISDEALAVARERWPDLPLLRGDAHALPAELRRGRFDLVYTGGGVLAWLHDLDAWAAGIASALAPGGELILHDAHPAATCLDAFLRWRDDYFDESVRVASGWEHVRLPGPPARERTHQRFWRLGQVVTSVAAAGLVVRALDELPGEWHWRRLDSRVPGEFVLVAAKPAAV
jgi:SAM-dependent methyltransferase